MRRSHSEVEVSVPAPCGTRAQTPSSLGEIAFLAGFSDQSAFSRAFKAHTGLTPTAFRSSCASA